MYKKYEQFYDDKSDNLQAKACYTLKQDLYCNNGVFLKGSVVRVKSVDSCAGAYVYFLESDNVIDCYCLKADKHTYETIEQIFEYNLACTNACNEIETLYTNKRNRISSRLWIYAAIIITAGIFVFVSGCNLFVDMSFWINISFMLFGISLFLAELYIPMYTSENKETILAKKEHIKISAILKAG